MPDQHLENLLTGKREELPRDDFDDKPPAVFGVITYIINDARIGEFDDNPMM